MTTLTATFAALAVLGLIGSAFMSFAEGSLLSADPRLLKQQSQDGNRAARETLHVVTNPAALHGTLLLLNNIFNLTYSIVGHRLLEPLLLPLGATLPQQVALWVGILASLLILDAIILLLGEITPKTWALSSVNRNALRIGPWVYRIDALINPLSRLIYAIPARLLGKEAAHRAPLRMTEAQLRFALELGTTSGAIEQSERELGLKVIDVAETLVERVMTLRRDIVSLPAEMTVRDALAAIRQVGYSRIPLYRNADFDDVIGFIHVRDLMGAWLRRELSRPLQAYARPAFFIPEKKRVFDLMLDFRTRRSPVALVVDEAGSIAGLVTLEDCLEEVVGEIYDEHDKFEELLQQVGDNTFIVDGRLEVDEAIRHLGVELDEKDYQTFGGLVMGLIGHVPVTGTRIHHKGLTITVTRMVGRRIDKLRVHRHLSAGGEEPVAGSTDRQHPNPALFADRESR